MRFLSAFLLVALLATAAFAAPPATINLHGQLLSSSGTPVSGSRAYTVQFHDAGTGGNAIGSALTGTVDVSADGLFNLEVTPPAGILTAAEVWYSLGVDTDEPADSSAADDVFPSRIRVHSVPFALQANEVVAVDAVRIGGGAVDNTEFGALDGVTGNIQSQIDAIDATGIAADISQLETDVAAKANSTDVYTKTEVDSTVTSLETDIAAKANSTDVYTKSEVDTTVTGLQTNISAKANSTDVYTKSEVDTTVTGLQTNISAKANSTDVYAKTDADDKFLDVTGDTMAGALGVDTIGEATAAAGVTVDGVLLKDNFVELAAISAPGVTSNKLYNTGGNLFWNGTQLNGGGGGGARYFDISIGDLTLGTGTSANRTYWSKKMHVAGEIVLLTTYCRQAGAVGDLELRKNGVSILTGDLVFTPETLLDQTSSIVPGSADFEAGDIISIFTNTTSGTTSQAHVNLTIEY